MEIKSAGENPSVFFKTYKLNRAATLIVEGKYNISAKVTVLFR